LVLIIVNRSDLQEGLLRCAMAVSVYVVVGILGLMFLALSLLGLDTSVK